jgi:hypothetical protein
MRKKGEREARGRSRRGHGIVLEGYEVTTTTGRVKLRGPGDATATVAREAQDKAIEALALFAPKGKGTLRPEDELSLTTDGGMTLRFRADVLGDVASVVRAFAVVHEQKEEAGAVTAPTVPEIVFAPKPSQAEAPGWITDNPDYKPRLVGDDGAFVLEFTPLAMNEKRRYMVERKVDPDEAEFWGYEVLADGRRFGWVVLMEPGVVLVTGCADRPHSKHRTLLAAMIRISSILQSTADNPLE